MKKKGETGIDLGLTDEEKSTLHKIAFSAIESRLKGGKTYPGDNLTDKLKEKSGAFVSLHRGGKLRGCIGYIHGIKPLYETIHEMAVSAAFHDPRFEPLKEEELKDLDIELSVLTPFKLITDTSEIEIGKHGLMIVKNNYSGLLLPQVATQYNWDRQTFLCQTCVKAGLPADAWKDKDTKIYIFSADIF